MDRATKEQLVSVMNKTFQDSTLVVVTHQSGLTVAEATDLTKKQVAAVFDALAAEIKKNLGSRGAGMFTIPGLLKIEKKRVPARPAQKNVRNPFTGEFGVLIGTDAIHGHGMSLDNATIFPSPISLASSFDPALLQQVAEITALEMRATGFHWTFSPNVDVVRDARWGRTGETFGEDTWLVGELGAGKTLFVKGVAAGLGLSEHEVASPTFVIANEYETASGVRLVHADLYRLSSEAELESAGFLDWISPGRVALIEWGDRVAGALPRDHLRISFRRAEEEGSRELVPTATGPSSAAVLARWEELCSREASGP